MFRFVVVAVLPYIDRFSVFFFITTENVNFVMRASFHMTLSKHVTYLYLRTTVNSQNWNAKSKTISLVLGTKKLIKMGNFLTKLFERATPPCVEIDEQMERMSLLDVDEDPLKDILDMLNLTDLTAVASTCTYLERLAQCAFKKRGIRHIVFRNNEMRIVECEAFGDIYFLPHAIDTRITDTGHNASSEKVFIDKIDVMNGILDHFADDLVGIEVLHGNCDANLFNRIVQKCGHTVQTLAFDGNIDRAFNIPPEACPHLTSLSLKLMECDLNLVTCPQLTSITIHHSVCDDSGAFNDFIRRHRNLRHIHIDSSYITFGSAIIELTELESLVIHGFHPAVMPLCQLKKLKRIEFHLKDAVSDDILRFLRFSQSLESLEVLRISPLEPFDDPNAFEDIICAMTALRELWLDTHHELFRSGYGLMKLHSSQQLHDVTLLHMDEVDFNDLADLLRALPYPQLIRMYVMTADLDLTQCNELREICRPRGIKVLITFLHFVLEIPLYQNKFGEFLIGHSTIPDGVDNDYDVVFVGLLID